MTTAAVRNLTRAVYVAAMVSLQAHAIATATYWTSAACVGVTVSLKVHVIAKATVQPRVMTVPATVSSTATATACVIKTS